MYLHLHGLQYEYGFPLVLGKSLTGLSWPHLAHFFMSFMR